MIYLYYAIRLYEIILIARILMSWIRPDPYHPVVQWIHRLTDPVLEPVRRMLAAGGVRPATRVSTAGASVPTTEVVRFTHGDSEYVGLLRAHRLRWDEPVPIIGAEAISATVDFGRQAHVYDVRGRRYLGHRQRLTETIEPARAHLYALLPYRVAGVGVTEVPSGHRVAREFELRVSAQGDAQPGTHVLRVEVEDALGRIRPEYARNLEAPAGIARFRLPLALSDPSGIWKLRVRDAATGVTGETTFGCLLSLGNPR